MSSGKEVRTGKHMGTSGRQGPGGGTVMITTCTQFYFQTPHLDPAHAVPIPELIGGDSGGLQSLVSSPEHLLPLLRYSRKKHAGALLRHTTVQGGPPQHRMQRSGGASLPTPAVWLAPL